MLYRTLHDTRSQFCQIQKIAPKCRLFRTLHSGFVLCVTSFAKPSADAKNLGVSISMSASAALAVMVKDSVSAQRKVAQTRIQEGKAMRRI